MLEDQAIRRALATDNKLATSPERDIMWKPTFYSSGHRVHVNNQYQARGNIIGKFTGCMHSHRARVSHR
jgi:hypothetical protein